MMTLLRGVSAPASWPQSIVYVVGSQSTNTGTRLYWISGHTVVAQESAGTITSSPACMWPCHAGVASAPGFWAGVLGLSLNLGAYLSEVFRAAILSLDKGQREAGLSIGMSRTKIYRRVILPQALKIAVPTVGGYFISLLKDSSLVSFIAVNELLRHGTIVISNTFLSMQVYLMVAIIYFMLSFVAARAVHCIEQRLAPAHLRANVRTSSNPTPAKLAEAKS